MLGTGLGNWTRPGASSVQLLSLGRRSTTESWLKSAHSDLCVALWAVCVFWRVGRRFWHQDVCVWELKCKMCVCVRSLMWCMGQCWPWQRVVGVNSRASVSTMNSARDWWSWITELGALQCWIGGWAGSRDSVHHYAVNKTSHPTSETGRSPRQHMMDKSIDSASSAGAPWEPLRPCSTRLICDRVKIIMMMKTVKTYRLLLIFRS